jgi:hypothetical protein
VTQAQQAIPVTVSSGTVTITFERQ